MVLRQCEDGKWGFVDRNGKWVIEPCYDYIEISADHYLSYMDEYKYEPGCAFLNDKAVVSKDGNNYIVDKKGNETKLVGIDFVEAVYADCIVFSKDGMCGIMNMDGEIVVKAKYNYIG